MDSKALFALIESLHLPAQQWVVFGGACLAARDIRPTSDLELFVTPQLYAALKQDGWEEKATISTNAPYVTKTYGDVPVFAFITCGSEKWRPNVEEYLRSPELIAGKPFMPLREMYEWKASTAREKDLKDLVLIDNYLLKSSPHQ